jgi:hypothetical protein
MPIHQQNDYVLHPGNCQQSFYTCRPSSGNNQSSRHEVIHWRWWIDPGPLRLPPATARSAPAPWVLLATPLVDVSLLLGDSDSLAVMPMNGRHEPDPAVAMLVVVPHHKRHHPAAGLVLAAEGVPGGSPVLP